MGCFASFPDGEFIITMRNCPAGLIVITNKDSYLLGSDGGIRRIINNV